MKIKFCGANKNVTGSRHLLTINGKKILLDCGMYQGHRKDMDTLNKTFLFDPAEVDVVILSHAHIDHSGCLPLLTKQGFKGQIYSTFATRDIAYLMLKDAAKIQESDVAYWNKKHPDNMIEPSYDILDVEQTMNLFISLNYEQEINLGDGIKFKFLDAGHVLGSAIIVIDYVENGEEKRFVFTGDLGRKDLPILRNPSFVDKANFVLTESTYGNRLHDEIIDVEKELVEVVNNTYDRKGKIIIPSFALERAQEIIYLLHVLKKQGKIPKMPIYVDSPLSFSVTQVFKMHLECFDQEIKDEFINNYEDPFGFNELSYTVKTPESIKLNKMAGPAIIISASGMCEFGRILHHLKNNVENPDNTIMVIGFMAENTLGRKIVNREPELKIFGEKYRLRADVKVFNAFSAHADYNGILEFFSKIKGVEKTMIVHGNPESCQGMKEKLEKAGTGGKEVVVPELGDEMEL